MKNFMLAALAAFAVLITGCTAAANPPLTSLAAQETPPTPLTTVVQTTPQIDPGAGIVSQTPACDGFNARVAVWDQNDQWFVHYAGCTYQVMGQQLVLVEQFDGVVMSTHLGGAWRFERVAATATSDEGYRARPERDSSGSGHVISRIPHAVSNSGLAKMPSGSYVDLKTGEEFRDTDEDPDAFRGEVTRLTFTKVPDSVWLGEYQGRVFITNNGFLAEVTPTGNEVWSLPIGDGSGTSGFVFTQGFWFGSGEGFFVIVDWNPGTLLLGG